MYFQGTFVLAEGEYIDSSKIFTVQALYFPPSESRVMSLQMLGSLDLFMAPVTKKSSKKGNVTSIHFTRQKFIML